METSMEPAPPVEPPQDEDRKGTVRRLLVTTDLSVRRISDVTGTARSTIRDWMRLHKWERPAETTAGRRSVVRRRLDIVDRVLELAELHLGAAAKRAARPMEPADREREALFMTTIVALVQQHKAAEAALAPAKGGAPTDDRDVGPLPSDGDEPLHAMLARRFAEFTRNGQP